MVLINRRRALAGIASLGAAALPGTGAFAQGNNSAKPVRLLVGFGPGSSADVSARILAQALSPVLGQTVVVENRPGATSNLATEQVVHAPADGQTLLMGSIANTINAGMQPPPPFDFMRDLAPIASVSSLPNVLVVHPSLKVSSVQDLIKAAKAHPDEIFYGSSGVGTSPHLSAALFCMMADIRMTHVPYQGSAQAVIDLIAGRIGVMFSPASTVLQHIQAGRLIALATTGAHRAAIAPSLPTVSESGLPGFETSVWFGLLAPAGTPKPQIERTAAATKQALASKELQRAFAENGIDPFPGGPEEFARYIASETEKWGRVVRAAGITAG